MIKQEIKQGENIIRIETAESLEDAKKNDFREGEFSRFFLNDKIVSGYMDVIKFIVAKTKENNKNFVPEKDRLFELRKESIQKQNDILKKHLNEFKDKENNQSVIDHLDNYINKIDDYGVRIRK